MPGRYKVNIGEAQIDPGYDVSMGEAQIHPGFDVDIGEAQVYPEYDVDIGDAGISPGPGWEAVVMANGEIGFVPSKSDTPAAPAPAAPMYSSVGAYEGEFR